MKINAPYGSWPTDLSAQKVAVARPRLAEPVIDDGRRFWLESRAAEKGRVTVVMHKDDGQVEDVLPAPWSARSRVHEYGGGAYTVAGNDLYFVNEQGQQIYHLNLKTGTVSEMTQNSGARYGGLVFDARGKRLFAVREQHHGEREPTNSIIAIDIDHLGEVTLVEGGDFYAQLALSPDGERLAFVRWDHPNMPWDVSHLYWCELYDGGMAGEPIKVSDGHCSVFQPEWLDRGTLLWADDSDGWWKLYQLDLNTKEVIPLVSHDAEFAMPLWVLGMKTFGGINRRTVFACYNQDNFWHPVVFHHQQPDGWRAQSLKQRFTGLQGLAVDDDGALLVAAEPDSAATLWLWDRHQFRPLRPEPPVLRGEDIAKGQPFAFATSDGDTAFANFYPPTHHRYQGPEGDLPPAIFICHGGPTAQSDLSLNLKVQYWTQRGFAVVDVNYRGSTGFGRPYREKLKGAWGEADVQDMQNAARFVIDQKWVAADKCVIRGSSAGGFTVLAALASSEVFAAGVSLYGIGDLERLAADTHKFESRYLDSLIGPWPEQADLYQARSPLHKAERIQCPLLVFQGLEDKVVPPAQAETMVSAVRKQGIPVIYITYPGEAHGFRSAETIVNQLETELTFYRDVLNLGRI